MIYTEQNKPTIINDGEKYDTVYNIDVEDVHNYVVDGIRVYSR